MTNAELVRALNQIHLEASVVETLLCQYRAVADEANIRVLASVLAEACPGMSFDDFSEQWCLEKLGALLDDYVGVCRKVRRSPTAVKPNPPMFPVLFNVLLRSSYKYLSQNETEKMMTETAKMMAAAKIPRVIKMAEEEMAAETHKHLGFFKNGGGLPEA